ncbi:MAG: hypothetical protein SGI73_04635 [Chloroflexota bacterium]|nr:hypothetical protein [Chloroflexota bacterium]
MNVRDILLSNRIVGLVLLVLLVFIAGPNTLPRVLSNLLPSVIYEGVPCVWLRRADDRANHQSLLGRVAPNPIQLRINIDALPSDPAVIWRVRIIITNESLGSVPIVYDPNQVIVGDNLSNGLGLIFTPNISLTSGGTRGGNPVVADRDLRILGPRQRCVHSVEFPAGNVLIDQAITRGLVRIRAYYRNNSAGQVVQTNPVATPIFNDQGLWSGYVESDEVSIPALPPSSQ